MPDEVKGKRRYDSPRRREQAEATRRQVLDAAELRFGRKGYAATAMAAIARDAGVSLKTVYLAFETKSGLLRALWNARLRGVDGADPVGAQDWYREVLAEAEPERRLRLNARNARAVKERAGTLLAIIRDAAPVDGEIAALWARIATEFHANQRAVVAPLAADGRLREGLDEDRAADILWTLNHPDVWQLLVRDRGWSPEEWEHWFADAACAQLLRGPAAG